MQQSIARAMTARPADDASAGAGLAARLRTAGAFLQTGPFVVKVRSSLAEISASLDTLYRGHLLAREPEFFDFHVRVRDMAAPPSAAADCLRARWRTVLRAVPTTRGRGAARVGPKLGDLDLRQPLSLDP